MKRDELFQHAVVSDLAMHIDGREASDGDIDREDCARSDVAALSYPHVRPHDCLRMYDRGPPRTQPREPRDDHGLRSWQTDAQHELRVVREVVLGGIDVAGHISETARERSACHAVVEEEEIARFTGGARLLLQGPTDLLPVTGGADHQISSRSHGASGSPLPMNSGIVACSGALIPAPSTTEATVRQTIHKSRLRLS